MRLRAVERTGPLGAGSSMASTAVMRGRFAGTPMRGKGVSKGRGVPGRDGPSPSRISSLSMTRDGRWLVVRFVSDASVMKKDGWEGEWRVSR